jgi:hypothetical protein
MFLLIRKSNKQRQFIAKSSKYPSFKYLYKYKQQVQLEPSQIEPYALINRQVNILFNLYFCVFLSQVSKGASSTVMQSCDMNTQT